MLDDLVLLSFSNPISIQWKSLVWKEALNGLLSKDCMLTELTDIANNH